VNSIAGTSTVSASLFGVQARSASALSLRAVVFLALASCVLTFALNAFWREFYTGDEGFYGVTAQNMLQARSYWLRPSYFPLGDFMADRDGFAHPPFNSYFYAIGLWAARGSLIGPEGVNLLALGALLYAAYRVVARVDAMAAKIAVVLLPASPAITGYYSMLEAEPLLTTFGVLALWCCLESSFINGRRWLFAGGICLGMAFALKLWLFGPAVLATLAALAFRVRGERASLTQAFAGGALFVLGAALPAGLHLAAIALCYPQDLSFWIRNIYFGIVTHSGISGTKFGGTAIPANWVHPVWYYGAALYRDNFFLVPPILFGAVSLWREPARRRRLALMLAAGAAGVIPLSLIKVKEPLYVLSCAVFLYLLGALCLSALVGRIRAGRPVDRPSWVAGIVTTLALLLLIPAAYLKGVQGDKITLTFVVVHSVVLAAFLVALLASTRLRSTGLVERLVYVGGVTAVGIAVALAAVTHRPRDPVIAQRIAPYLRNNAPTDLSFFASNFKSYQYYTFAKGCYWHELDRTLSPDALLALPAYAHVKVFILSPEDQVQNPAWVHWLEGNAVDKTPEIDRDLGQLSGYRVFVREPVAVGGGGSGTGRATVGLRRMGLG
jgi:hypothetical protein